MQEILIGSNVTLEWQFNDKSGNPTACLNATIKIFDSNDIQVGSSVVLTNDNEIGVGLYSYPLTIPNLRPFFDVEISVTNLLGEKDSKRPRIYTKWSEEDASIIPIVTLTVGTNTYISLADADTYLASQFGTEKWFESSINDKSRALITATAKIDQLMLVGRMYDPSQTLQCPRSRYSVLYRQWFSTGVIEPEVKNATCLEALEILIHRGDNERLKLIQQGVKRITIGNTTEEYNVVKSNISLTSNEAIAALKGMMPGSSRVIV